MRCPHCGNILLQDEWYMLRLDKCIQVEQDCPTCKNRVIGTIYQSDLFTVSEGR
jgi:phage FluMu protein Com